MAYYPISLFLPQWHVDGVPASGYILKAYQDGTSTLLQMATDNTGGTLVNSVALNSQGYPATSPGGVIFIPHVDQGYKLALYPTQAAADANSGAVWTIDNLTPYSIIANFGFSNNTMTSTNANGDIILDPNGTGVIRLNATTHIEALYLNGVQITAPTVSGFVSGSRMYLSEDGAVTTPTITVTTDVTENSFESVGPTGSGATNIWTPMDSIPSGARLAIIKIIGSVTSDGVDRVVALTVKTRMTGTSNDGNYSLSLMFGTVVDDNATGAYLVDRTVFVPLDTSRRFDITWSATNDSARSVILHLAGFVV